MKRVLRWHRVLTAILIALMLPGTSMYAATPVPGAARESALGVAPAPNAQAYIYTNKAVYRIGEIVTFCFGGFGGVSNPGQVTVTLQISGGAPRTIYNHGDDGTGDCFYLTAGSPEGQRSVQLTYFGRFGQQSARTNYTVGNNFGGNICDLYPDICANQGQDDLQADVWTQENLQPGGQDQYRFYANAGGFFAVAMVSGRLDSTLQVFNPDGDELQQYNQDNRLHTLPSAPWAGPFDALWWPPAPLRQTGFYTIVASSNRGSGPYLIKVKTDFSGGAYFTSTNVSSTTGTNSFTATPPTGDLVGSPSSSQISAVGGTTTTCLNQNRGDVDNDGHIDDIDLHYVVRNFGKSPNSSVYGDADNDGHIDDIDLHYVVRNFGKPPCP